MPPFDYQPFDPSRYSGSIGEILSRRGQVEANRAMQIANAQARATEASGQAWAGAAQQIGQTVGHTIAQQNDPQRQAAQLQVDELKRANRSRNIFEAELRNPSNYNPDGSINDAAVSDRLRKQDVGAWQSWSALSAKTQKDSLDLRKALTDLASSTLTLDDKQRQSAEARHTYLGRLALNAEDVLKQNPSDAPHARDTFLAAVARAGVDGAIDGTQARTIAQQFATATPDQIAGAFGQFITPELRAAHDKSAADLAKTKADADKATAEAENLRKYGAVTAPRPPNSQESKFRLDGRDVTGDYVPGANGQPGRYFFNGQDVTGKAAPIPSASVTIHNEKDAEGAKNRGDIVEMLVDGRMAPSMLSKRTDDYNATLAEANRLSKERTGKGINIAQLETDYAAARRWVQAMNAPQMIRFKGLATSVVNTIDEVKRLADELKQGSIQKWNSVTRATVQQLYGNTPQSELANRYMVAVNTLKEEFANLANGGYAPTEAAWKLANEQINGNFGFKDFTATLGETQRLINYRVNAFDEVQPTTLGGTPQPKTNQPIKVGGFTVTVNP